MSIYPIQYQFNRVFHVMNIKPHAQYFCQAVDVYGISPETCTYILVSFVRFVRSFHALVERQWLNSNVLRTKQGKTSWRLTECFSKKGILIDKRKRKRKLTWEMKWFFPIFFFEVQEWFRSMVRPNRWMCGRGSGNRLHVKCSLKLLIYNLVRSWAPWPGLL